MRIAVFSTRPYDGRFLGAANAEHGHDLTYLDARLDATTATFAAGHDAACIFVNDVVDADVVAQLAAHDVRLLALRCAAAASARSWHGSCGGSAARCGPTTHIRATRCATTACATSTSTRCSPRAT